VVVGHIAVEATSIRNKVFPLFFSGTSFESRGLKSLKVNVLEVSKENTEEGWALIRNLMRNHLGAFPAGLGQVIGIVAFFKRKVLEGIAELQILDS